MNKLSFFVVFNVVGVVLVLGSVVAVPYTVRESYFKEVTGLWADESFILEPNEIEMFDLDIVVVNSSIVNIRINTTDVIYLKVTERLYLPPVWEIEIQPEEWAQDLFWTYPYYGGVWYFVFENRNPTEVNVTVKITEYWPRVQDWHDVTYYSRLLDPYFAYPGIAAIILATILIPRNKPQQTPENIKE